MSNKGVAFIEFGKIAEFRNGLNFSKSSHGTGCLLVGVSDFQKNFTPDYDSLEEINPEGITKNDDYLKKGDILFVRSNGNKALVGRSLYIDRDINSLFSGFCIRARLISNLIDPLFLAYFTRSKHFKSSISFVAGTSINNLNQDILSNVKLPLYSKDIQFSITKILSALDSKIELNKRINAELEAMAKTLYDYWFVQFDFPDQHGKPYKTSGGKMVWNDVLKREIPDSWDIKKLADITNVSNESINPIITPDKKFKHYSIPNFDETGTYKFEKGEEIKSNKFLVKETDVLVSKLNPWFNRVIFTTNEKDLICSTEFVIWRTRCLEIKNYLFMIARDNSFISYCTKSAAGTSNSHKRVNPTVMMQYEIIYNEEIAELFGSKIESAIKMIAKNDVENQQLAELRDWLLPMLMNGQVTAAENSKKSEVRLAMAVAANVNYPNSIQEDTEYSQIEIAYTTVWANQDIGVKQGDMATSKDIYLIDRICNVKTNFNFARHNWGAFDPLEKRILNDPQYFRKVNFLHSQARYIDLKDNGSLLEKIPAELKDQISNGIKEMNDKVFGKYFGKQKAEMKELYATVLMCIEDKQSLSLNEIRSEMASWKVTQGKTEMTKAEKFSEAETQEALEVIIKENWYKNVLTSV